jgi:hypothetical protein
MTGPQPLPGAAVPAIDSGDDDDDLVDGAGDLPDDVPNDALTASEMQVPAGSIADTDVDAPVVGTPLTDDEIGA